MTSLPDHVRNLVDEIETEIGDDGKSTASDIAGTGALTGPDGPVEEAVRQILTEIGEDPDRAGLVGTPDRVHRMYAELTAGYHVDPNRLLNGAVYDVTYSEMVVVKDIPFYSLCEHHLLPFFGNASVAYIPRGRVVGLSKIPRIVETYARRLQLQERLTQQIAEFINERLNPQGVGVVIEATHLCAVMRGVRKPGTVMTTAAVLGLFRTRDRTRAEFYSHLERRPPSQ
ncbi:MAG TPA: GTP cyclohydrolase I FolE [Candidatus Acidoferrales bacterium]|jgi:GTP cyclohydrolase IA|nr:GTP cyclohydrolase I FolE [Candidatus Acidoferrales bacterium]